MNQTSLDELLTKWNGGILRGAPRKFAKKMGVEEATVSRWRRGNAIDPELRPRVAKLLGCRAEDLVREVASPSKVAELLEHIPASLRIGPARLSVIEVPIVGRVAASGIDYAPDEPPRGTTPFPLYGPTRGRLEALLVSGRSMEPTIPDKSFVILKDREFFRSGALAVVRVHGQVLIKRAIIHGDSMDLVCDNKRHKTLRYASKEVEILAAVHQVVTVWEP